MRHLPNALTAFRLVSAPVLAALLCAGGVWQEWAAFALFAAAAATDHLDGYLARRWRAESDWGRQLDPLADKLLIAAGLIGLTMTGTLGGIHLAAAGVILFREVLVSAAREKLAHRGEELPVTTLARLKTAIQGTAIGLLLAVPLTDVLSPMLLPAGLGMLWAAAGLTVWTGIHYLRRAWTLLRPSVEHAP
jgi:cardiolipin synthase (CMP-forming)